MGSRTRDMILCAVFAAILCVFSVITFPIGTVPITLGVFGVLVVAIVLGRRNGVVSVLVFILLGCVGLPVFNGARGGIQVLTGPTGGYIISYVGMAYGVGWAADRVRYDTRKTAIVRLLLACTGGILFCYLLGTLQFMAVTEQTIGKALITCVYPFILPDLTKAGFAVGIGYAVRKRL